MSATCCLILVVAYSKAKTLLNGDEPFLVHNADIFTDLNLQSIIDFHNHAGADVTLLTKQRDTQRYLVLDSDNRMMGWTNIATGEVKPADLDLSVPHEKLAFGGIHVISPRIFKSLENYSEEPKFSITPYYIASCREIKIYGYNPSGYNWFDIGKLETLKKAEDFIHNK